MTDQRNRFTKVSWGTDEFTGFLGEYGRFRGKAAIYLKIPLPAGVAQRLSTQSSLCSLQAAPLQRLLSLTIFTTSLDSGRSRMSDAKFLELPESYKFPLSFLNLLASAPSLYKRRF